MSSWGVFLHELLEDLKLWLVAVLCLGLGRAYLIFHFRENISPGSGLSDLALVLLSGFRYDAVVATYLVMIPLAAGAASAVLRGAPGPGRLRKAFALTFVFLTSFLAIVTVEYFAEYGDQFNHFLFGFYHDDTSAIISTIWKDYHAARNITLLIVLTASAYAGWRMFSARTAGLNARLSSMSLGPRSGWAVAALVLIFVFFGSRGSLGGRPVQRYDAEITKDSFLNRTTMNPYFALKFAVRDYMNNSASSGVNPYIGALGGMDDAVGLICGGEADLDLCFARQARGGTSADTKQIFIVLMESFDAWPLMKEYEHLGLAEEFKELADEGILLMDFLASGKVTIESVGAMLTGLPNTRAPLSYMEQGMSPFPTSAAMTFRRLGYRTRFYYAGNLRWQRIEEFARGQGFEEVYGTQHMGEGAKWDEWGVEDEDLYEFVLEKTKPGERSFNFILTTANHPPYSVDVEAKGFALRDIPEEFVQDLNSSRADLTTLGHTWYTGRSAARFVRAASKRMPGAVFAMTGDHHSRRHIRRTPDPYEAEAVPLLLYGPRALKGKSIAEGAAGCQLDIVPTLVELVAPGGFTYHASGTDLLSPGPSEGPLRLVVGASSVMGEGFIAGPAYGERLHQLPWGPVPGGAPSYGDAMRVFRAFHALGWQRVMCGPRLGDGECG